LLIEQSREKAAHRRLMSRRGGEIVDLVRILIQVEKTRGLGPGIKDQLVALVNERALTRKIGPVDVGIEAAMAGILEQREETVEVKRSGFGYVGERVVRRR
jgi:hypothetical protein